MIDTSTLITVITFITICGGIWYENAQQELVPAESQIRLYVS